MNEIGPETVVGIFWCLWQSKYTQQLLGSYRNLPTNLSLRVALFSLECHVVVGTESEVAAFALERRQVSAVFALGTTGPFQVEPNSKPNSRTKLGTGLAKLADVSVTRLSSILRWYRRERRICVSVGCLKAERYRLDHANHISNPGNLLRHYNRHCIADDLYQLAIRIGLTNQDSGVATPAQGKSRSVMKDRVRVPRALDVEMYIAPEGCSDFPVEDEPQLESIVNKRRMSAKSRNQFTLSQNPTEGEGSLGALDSVSNILITSWIV